MAKYTSGRQKELKVGIHSYSEQYTSLEVVGKVGINTRDATSHLTVYGDGLFTGIVTAQKFVGEFELTTTTFEDILVTGIATINRSSINSSSIGIATITNLDADYIQVELQQLLILILIIFNLEL